MKNFSAKNAEFETLKINNEAAITSANIGTDPNKIPLNKDLGSLAYQDAVNLDDVSADMLELRAIAAEISDSAVDVFVYDTSRDSDGGAWRKRTQHTSWYNEELNTATRGARREFPAVAVIVTEANKVTIYDGDDPDMGMWMVFNIVSGMIYTSSNNLTSISMLNGSFVWTSFRSGIINFIAESAELLEAGYAYNLRYGIVNRNVSGSWSAATSRQIVNNTCNDVAMTVLPNAPIDLSTGLPVPTIAVATDGGVSVIKDDGTVISTVSDTNYKVHNIDLQANGNLFAVLSNSSNANYGVAWAKNYTDISGLNWSAYTNWNSIGGFYYAYVYGSNLTYIGGDTGGTINDLSAEAFGSFYGLTRTDKNPSDFDAGLVSFISSSYNTGWMPGDIKLATLSDTTVENIGVNSDELVVDGDGNWVGDFNVAADIDSWEDQSTGAQSVDSSNVDIDNNTITLTRSVGDAEQISKLLNLVEGQTYNLTFEITSATQDKGQIWIGTDLPLNNQIIGDIQTANEILNTGNTLGVGLYSYVFKAKDVNYLTIRAGGDGTIKYKDISIRATTELITNGDFSNGTTGWTETSDPSLTVTNGKLNLKCLSGDNQAGIHQNFLASDPSRKYTLSFDIDSFTGDTAANLIVGVDDYWDNTNLGSTELFSIKESGSYSFTFNGRSGGMSILFRVFDRTGSCSQDTSINIDNISVRPAEEDRSVNNNGLQVIGEINKAPVAPGTDLVAYSGFSENNYLVQPYNADLDFGTGDFCVMGWFKNANANALLCARLLPQLYNTSGTDRGFLISFGSSGVLSFATYTQGFRPTGRKSIGSQNDMSGIDSWNHFVVVRDGGVMKLYINAIKEISETANSDDISDDTTSIPLSIGCLNEISGNRFTGSTALIRISATAPTAAQVAKIYRDEKVLFQDHAQATLYGTSDSVTALAYDDSEQLLHVGTASGRSDFRGLARVNNTTTAISNSISAAEGTIIQN